MNLRLVEFGKFNPVEEWNFTHDFKGNESFKNNCYDCDFPTYLNVIIPKMQNEAKGINLAEGYVPQTSYYLIDDQTIVGIFKVRHYCNEETLHNGTGHIGFAIKEQYRNQGYGKKGLALAIEELRKMQDYRPQENIIMGCDKDNIASLKVQQANGATIIEETENRFVTEIK